MSDSTDRFELRVVLLETEPSVWRTFTVPVDITLPELHVVLQVVMGWYDEHLFAFHLRPKGSRAKTRQRWKTLSEQSRKSLETILASGDVELIYEYDFGDSWLHQIRVLKRSEGELGAGAPQCTGGSRACPPEDCGGVYGYQRLLEALGEPKDPEHEEILEWLGEDFDADSFDREEVSLLLAELWDEDA